MSVYIYNENELMHFGVKGMKWGIRRYQPYRGSRPSGGKEVGEAKKVKPRNLISDFKVNRKAKKVQKQRSENLKKARDAAAAKREHEKNKEKALKSFSATEVLKYKDELSAQDLQNAANRIKWANTLADYSKSEKEAKFNKMNDVMTKVSKVNTWAKTATDVYKTSKDIKNILEELKRSRNNSSGSGSGGSNS